MSMPSKPLDLSDSRQIAKAEAAKAALEKSSDTQLPTPEIPAPDLLTLPGGLITEDGNITTARVRELTGEHEEALARAIQSDNPFHFFNVLLESGIEQLGDLSPEDTKRTVRDLTVGDRDELALAIRIATYGDRFEVPEWECPNCGNKVDLMLDLTPGGLDVPHKTLASPADARFEVLLPKSGNKAVVRLANGHDQLAVNENVTLTVAQRNSTLLSRCVESVTDKNGITQNIAAFPSLVRKMSLVDRHAILEQLTERQPGPRYTEIKFEHEECGKEVTLALGIRDLFRDLFLYL